MNLLAPAVLLCAFALIPLVNWPVLRSLQERWAMDGQPGYAVVALSLYFAWKLLRRGLEQPARPSPLAALMLLGTGLVSLAGHAAQVQVVQQVALWLQIGLWIAAVLGWHIARLLLPALLMLLFALPLFDFLVDPLRVLSVAVTKSLLRLGDIPAFIDGYYITVPAGRFFVAGGCSGLNFLIAGTMIGYLHAYLHFSRRWRQLLVILLAAGLAVVGNWVRIYALVLIGYYNGMESDLIAEHGTFGWWIFAGAMALFFLLSHYLALRDPRHGRSITPRPMAAQPIPKLVGWGVVMLALTASIPSWVKWQESRHAGRVLHPAVAAPEWRPIATPRWQPRFETFDVASFWQVRHGVVELDLQVLTWADQRQGKEMIYYRNVIAAERDVLRQTVVVPGPGMTLNQSVVNDRGAARLVWWFYWVGDRTTTRDDVGKALQLLAFIEGEPVASLVALSLPCASPLCQSEQSDEDLAAMRDRLLRQLLSAGRG